jgi:DNA-binding NarL/FixJ family response regulator
VIFLFVFENTYYLKKTSQVDLEGALLKVLTPREREVALLILKGMTNREIAGELNVSENTVKTHIRSVLQKACVPNKIGFLVRYRDYKQ